MENVTNELVSSPPSLKHVTHMNDRSSPVLEPGTSFHPFAKQDFLTEVAQGVPLKHTSVEHDASAPRVEEGVHIQPSNRPALLCEIKAAGAHSAVVHELKANAPILAHVSTVDKAAPAIPPDATLKMWDKAGLLSDIRDAATAGKLAHVEDVKDHSAPHIPPGTKVQSSQLAKELVSEIKQQQGAAGLRHLSPEEVADKSAPKVSATAAMRIHSHPIASE